MSIDYQAQTTDNTYPKVDDEESLKPAEGTLEEKLDKVMPELSAREQELYPLMLKGTIDNINNLLPKRNPQQFGVYEGYLQSQVRDSLSKSLKAKDYNDLAEIVEEDVLGTSYFFVMNELEEKSELESDETQELVIKLLGYDNGLNEKQKNTFSQVLYGVGLFNKIAPFGRKIDTRTIIVGSIMNNPNLSAEEKEELLQKIGVKDLKEVKEGMPDPYTVQAPEKIQLSLPTGT